jgi:hypothetical protein
MGFRTIKIHLETLTIKGTKKMRQLVLTAATFASLFFAGHSQAQETVASDFKPTTNIYGYVFGDYYLKTHSDSLSRGGGNVQYRGVPNRFDAFQVRRAYLGFEQGITKDISATVLLADEAGPSLANTGTNLDASGYNSMYLKFGYLKWNNIFKNSSLNIGQFMTCSYATANNSEQLMGYRVIERTIMDMHNNDNVSDLGLSLQGNLWTQSMAKDSLKPTFLGYIAQVGNFAGAKPETDKFKKVRGNLFVSTLQQKLVIGLYADFNQVKLNPINQSTTTLKAYADYKTDWFNIGFEAFTQRNKNGDSYKATIGAKDSTIADGVQQGLSIFLCGRIIKHRLNYYARIDFYNPDASFKKSNFYTVTNTGSDATSLAKQAASNQLSYEDKTFYRQTFYTFGFDYTPMSRIHILPNIWCNKYTTMMGSVGTKELTANQKKGFDFVPRITAYYIFNANKKVANNGMDN